MKFPLARLVQLAALCLPPLASAQPAQPARPDPADPKAPAPALRHASAFADYKPWTDLKPGDWRSANDSLRDAAAKGGHAGHGGPKHDHPGHPRQPVHGGPR